MSDSIDQTPIDVALLGDIYGAAVSPTAWPEVLDRCTAHVGARCGTLLSFDALDQSTYSFNILGKLLREGLTDVLAQQWLTEFAHLEKEAHHQALAYPAQHLFIDSEQYPDLATLRARPDYQFLEMHFGIGHKMFARLNDNARYFDNLAFQFPAELNRVPSAARPAMLGLLPHVAKSVEMGVLYDRLQHNYSAVLSALDLVGIGLCVVEANGCVAVANAESRRTLDAGHGITLASSLRLTCTHDADSIQLTNAIRKASLSQPGTHVRAESMVTIRQSLSSAPVIVEISPLRDHLNEIDVQSNAVLIQLVDTECRHHLSAKAFVEAYRLTEAEAAVVELVLMGLTNREIAESRGTSIDTTKSQIKSLMTKAKVKSRVQLVRLIAKTDPPVTNQVHNGYI